MYPLGEAVEGENDPMELDPGGSGGNVAVAGSSSESGSISTGGHGVLNLDEREELDALRHLFQNMTVGGGEGAMSDPPVGFPDVVLPLPPTVGPPDTGM